MSYYSDVLTEKYAISKIEQHISVIHTFINTFYQPEKEVLLRDNTYLRRDMDNRRKRHNTKQAAVFTKGQLDTYLANRKVSLVDKAVAIIGFTGLLRFDDLQRVSFPGNGEFGVFDQDEYFEIRIPPGKTDKSPVYFFVLSSNEDDLCYVKILRSYIEAVPEEYRTGKFFKAPKKLRNNSVIYRGQAKGKSMKEVPMEIAKVNNLPDPRSYTGHSFRRSGATSMAENGATARELQRRLRHKNNKTAENYVDDSDLARKRDASFIQGINNGENNSRSTVINVNIVSHELSPNSIYQLVQSLKGDALPPNKRRKTNDEQ